LLVVYGARIALLELTRVSPDVGDLSKSPNVHRMLCLAEHRERRGF
jgi:hypothetical protein